MTNRRRLVGGVLIATVLLVGGLALAGGDIADRMIDPAPTTVTTNPAITLTPDERAFYEYVAPRLAQVTAESAQLVRLAERRSRNLLELQTRGQRIDDGAQAIDDYVRDHGVPNRFAEFYSLYQLGIDGIRSGMDEARAGFFSFDWDRVAAAVDQFSVGADNLARSLETLEIASGATPTAHGSPESLQP